MDIQLGFTQAGEGEPLLLLHGNGESRAYFDRQIPAFAAHYHVFAVDTRGHGASKRGTAPFTLSQFKDDLAAFLDAQGVERAHLLGFSDGGNIALLFALAFPERVQSLILNGANLFPGGVKRRYQLPIELGYRAAKRAAAKSEKAQKNAELLSLMVNEPQIDPKELSTLAMPVLVIAGTHDMIQTAHTRLIAQSIPGAQLRLLKGDHFVAAKHPAVFNRAVLDFLESVPLIK